MDNNLEPWEREWREFLNSPLGFGKNVFDRINLEKGPIAAGSAHGYRAAHLRQQARIDKLRAVLQELRDCSEYWSEYDVPVGIVERMDAVLADHVPDTTKMIDHIGDTNKKEE